MWTFPIPFLTLYKKKNLAFPWVYAARNVFFSVLGLGKKMGIQNTFLSAFKKTLNFYPYRVRDPRACLWTRLYLIRTIDYILAPTKHLENFITIVFLSGNNESTVINRDVNVSQIVQWVAGWHTASIVSGSSPVDSILFFMDWCSSLKKIFHHYSSYSDDQKKTSFSPN
jgi:hypothetical protein